MSKQDSCNVATLIGTNVSLMQNATSNDLWKAFGSLIRDRREELHLSQAGAAQKAGIDRQQWYRIESGKSGTKRDTVIAIAAALDMPATDLLTKAGFAGELAGGLDFEMTDGVHIKMQGGKDYSDEDRRRFEMAFRVAYAQAKEMIEEESTNGKK